MAKILNFILSVGLMLPVAANAADLVWSGKYRFEGVRVKGTDLNDGGNKAYMLHHLSLTPKIVAADGLTIYSRWGLLNNSTYANSPFGDYLGRGPNSSTGTAGTNASNSNVLARSQSAGGLAVHELYASWIQEFGQLVVGRAPLHFGFGGAINAGYGLFDKYNNTLDMVGYKIVIGNFFFMPIMGKVDEGSASVEDDVNNYIIHAQYENPDTDIALGFWVSWRQGATAGNDVPVNFGGATATKTGGFDISHKAGYLKQKGTSWDLGVEVHQVDGGTGLTTSSGTNVNVSAYAFLSEFQYHKKDSAWTYGLKAGVASGDDPNTTDIYEGFILSQNYDLGLLMFNHPLGQNDFFRTSMLRGTGTNQPDTEAISNAVYFSPSFQHQWKDRVSWGMRFVTGQLLKDPIANSGAAKSLGYEFDINLTYKPYERLSWVTEFGYMIPGEAWAGGSSGYDRKAPIGIATKAAIQF